MPLAPYSEQHWFKDGTDATGELAYVYPRKLSVLAPLFQDQAGTVPLPNPLNIGPGGMLSFFVDNGDYWVYVNGQSFYVVVDLDETLTRVWPATFVHDHAVAETVWTINHGLESRPAVAVLVDGQISFADTVYLDDNSLTITFAEPTAGTAYLRR